MYRVIRMYQENPKTRTIKRGMTLKEAQAHCSDPETSSSTCTTKDGLRRTEVHGRWFAGYEEEK